MFDWSGGDRMSVSLLFYSLWPNQRWSYAAACSFASIVLGLVRLAECTTLEIMIHLLNLSPDLNILYTMPVLMSACMAQFNPFTAPVCKISGLKDARTRLGTEYFPVTATFSAIHFDKKSFHVPVRERKQKSLRVKFRRGAIFGPSRDIMAVKGLTPCRHGWRRWW